MLHLFKKNNHTLPLRTGITRRWGRRSRIRSGIRLVHRRWNPGRRGRRKHTGTVAHRRWCGWLRNNRYTRRCGMLRCGSSRRGIRRVRQRLLHHSAWWRVRRVRHRLLLVTVRHSAAAATRRRNVWSAPLVSSAVSAGSNCRRRRWLLLLVDLRFLLRGLG